VPEGRFAAWDQASGVPQMKPDRGNNYGKWSKEELRKAEATARQFLEDNGAQISETLRTKVKYLDLLVNRLSNRRASLDERLDCFARIGEISQLLKDDAEGFFELASQPVVAQILNTVRSRK
jgi:exonuclease VII small subunit